VELLLELEEEQSDSSLVLLVDCGAVWPLFMVDHVGRARATYGEESSLGGPLLAFAETLLMGLQRHFAGAFRPPLIGSHHMVTISS
jgi:hypothetical protein